MFLCVSKKAAHRAAAGLVCAAVVCCGAAGLRAHGREEPAAVTVFAHEWGLSFQEENQPPVPKPHRGTAPPLRRLLLRRHGAETAVSHL